MKQFDVRIEGVSPGLLMHRFPEATQAGLVSSVKLVGKKKPTPEDEAEQAAYRLENGDLGQPAEHIFQALVRAAGEFQVQGRGKKTYRDAVRGGLLVEPDVLSHGRQNYEIDARPVRVQRARIVRHRPWLRQWALTFRLTVLESDQLPDEVLNGILVRAGQSVGIGDFRPRYGRFVVTKFEQV